MTRVYVTVEQAVARVMKFDYVLDGFDLFETLYAFLEDAESEYEKAKQDPLLVDEVYRLRVAVCQSRCELAESIRDQLTLEFIDSENKIEQDSVDYWAAVTFGIEVVSDIPKKATDKVVWKDVTIKIYKDYKLDYKMGKNSWKHSHFRDFDLMGNRKSEPNNLGDILINLSEGQKYPAGTKLTPTSKESVPLSKIRMTLKKQIGIDSDPFYPFNKSDGWKPIFKLVDARRVGDERAKERAVHVSYDDEIQHDAETSDFDYEDDEAGKWLDKKQQ